jgi:hypothetical protein
MEFLARADSTDLTYANLTLIFVSLVVLGTAAFLGFLIIRAARIRRPHHADTFAALSVLWVVLTAGTAIYDVTMQQKWSRESASRLESGYYDPTETAQDAPSHPWAFYGVSGVGYGVLWLLVGLNRRTPSPP